jgi:hypothetical protein
MWVVPDDCECLGVGGAILDVAVKSDRCSTVAPTIDYSGRPAAQVEKADFASSGRLVEDQRDVIQVVDLAVTTPAMAPAKTQLSNCSVDRVVPKDLYEFLGDDHLADFLANRRKFGHPDTSSIPLRVVFQRLSW